MIPFPRSSLVILLVYFHLEYRKKTHNYSADFSYSSLLVSLTPTTNFLPTFQFLLEMLLAWDKLIADVVNAVDHCHVLFSDENLVEHQ
jgi:hypothetical protein